MHEALREIKYIGNSHVCLQDIFQCLRRCLKRNGMQLTWLEYRMLTFLWSCRGTWRWMGSMSFGLIKPSTEWQYRTGTNYCFSVHKSFRPNLCIFNFDLTKKPFAMITNISAGLDFTAAHVNHCLQYKSLWVCSMVQIWLKIQHFGRKIMLIINRDSY